MASTGPISPRRRSFGKKFLLWCLWVALITAPFLWIRLEYDFVRRTTLVRVQAERLRAVFVEGPRWLFEHGAGAVGLALVVAALAGALHRWKWRSWVQWGRERPAFAARSPALARIGRPVALVLMLVLPPLLLGDKYLDMAVFVGLYILLALGLNFTVGMTGLLVLGYAAFYAIGAYTFGILQRELGTPFWLAFLPAAALAALAGFLLGLPSLRLRGDYLAIVTLGFGETTRYVLKNLGGLTGGDFGIIIDSGARIPVAVLPFGLGVLSRLQVAYLLIFVLVAASIVVVHRINHSRIGRAWIAIREDEVAASTMGINTVRLKILAFTLSAIWAGLAGVFYAAYVGFINPEVFRFEESVLILSMVVLGGMGSGPGVILGAVVLCVVPRLLRDQLPALVDYRLMIFGATMVVMMVFRPQGLIGSVRRRIELEPNAET